jgi:hypothetical protein
MCIQHTGIKEWSLCDLFLAAHYGNQVRVFQPPSMTGHTETFGGGVEDCLEYRRFAKIPSYPKRALKGFFHVVYLELRW